MECKKSPERKKAVMKLKKLLEEKGCPKVVVNDLARCDMAEAVEGEGIDPLLIMQMPSRMLNPSHGAY